MDPALKFMLLNASDSASTSMGEYVVRVLARHFKRPDLAAVPRKRMGRMPRMRAEKGYAPMKEERLALKVVSWLTGLGWEVYQEVSVGDSRCADIVAVKDGILWTIETKCSMSISVLEQAHGWRGYSHLRSVAVPDRQRVRRKTFSEDICKLLGIGILHVESEVRETIKPRMDQKIRSDLKGRLREEQKTFAPAGNASGQRWIAE